MSTGQAPSTSFRQQLLRRKPVEQDADRRSTPVRSCKRTIGTFQLTMFGVGATVGTGIFFVLQEAVPDAGPAVIISFILAGIAAGLSALCYAEMASAIPVSGSTYSYAYAALGELVAMVVAACVLLEYGVSTAAVAVGWSGYFNKLLGEPVRVGDSRRAVVCAARARGGRHRHHQPARRSSWSSCARMLLIRGASESAKVNAVMVVIKLAVLVMFVVIGLTAFDADNFTDFWGAGRRDRRGGRHHLLLLHRPGRRRHGGRGGEGPAADHAEGHHLGAASSSPASTCRSRSPASVRSPASEFEAEEQQSAGLAVILENITGTHLAGARSSRAGAVISIFSVTLVTLYGQTRILFAMGRDGMLPKRFAAGEPAHT